MQDFGPNSAYLPLAQTCSPSSDSTNADSAPCAGIRRRQRKTKAQLSALTTAFQFGRIWTHEDIQNLAKETGLKPSQVCKWRWDFDQKLQQETVHAQALLHCSETLRPLALHRDLHRLQKRYEAEARDTNSPSRFLA